jgi:4-amino-4-deoxy-L-arabinose transferase-like glycosyltransferase
VAHQVRARSLAGRLPEESETVEYFSPPLPYILPAFFDAIGYPDPGRIALQQNFFFSIALTLLIVKFARRLSPDQPFHAPMALLALAIVPVYYRTFAFFRGEPLLAFFVLLAVYLVYFSDGSLRNAAYVGLALACGVLSRQWGFIVIPPLMLYAVVARGWRLKHLVVAGLIVVALGAWFYLSLMHRYGTPMAFNRPPRNRGEALNMFTGTGNGLLFTNPVRGSFDNHVWPILYSETWGDYWGYWAGRVRDVLGRMNAVNLIPTLAVFYALIRNLRQRQYWLHDLIIVVGIVGYMAFLTRYQNGEGDTIKPTYLLQLFPLVALIAGDWFARHWRLVLVVGTLLLIHNAPLFIWQGQAL